MDLTEVLSQTSGLDLTMVLNRPIGTVVAKGQVQGLNLTEALSQTSGLDLTEVLTEDIWTDLLSDLNIYTQSNSIFESTDYLQLILLDNVQKKRYKQPVKTVGVTDEGDIVEEWLLDDVHHREDGPARQQWGQNGTKQSESWYQNGQFHRDDGPALSGWRYDGTKINEIWFQDGQQIPNP